MPQGVGFLLVFIGPGEMGVLKSFCSGVGIRPSTNCPGVCLGRWSGLELIDTQGLLLINPVA